MKIIEIYDLHPLFGMTRYFLLVLNVQIFGGEDYFL